MARLIPGVRARMGRWTYYMVRMTMSEVSRVKFASEIEEGNALDEALQRVLNESRSKSAIATYLQRQPDRFFNSIVIASMGGDPKWFPINVEDDPALALIADDESIMGSFGILRFNGNEDYFALDGQHRLKAIKELLDPGSELYKDAPEGFDKEEQSVVLVVPGEAETPAQFKERFRRLFGHLNRYAKPMDLATSIIMDEDDAVAISTRRLFNEHEFFKTIGAQKDSRVIDTTKGSNITNPKSPHLTKLEVLYGINRTLLSTRKRELNGWFDSGEKLDEFIRFRPEDSTLDSIYLELSNYWDGLLAALPVLRSEASKMRNHAVIDSDEETDEQDLLLFWPIGQLVLAQVSRQVLDYALVDGENSTEVTKALSVLRRVPWDLNAAPWKHFFVVPTESGTWKMRSEDRKRVQQIAVSLIVGFLDPDGLPSEAENDFKKSWSDMLLPAMASEKIDDMWEEAKRRFAE